MVVFALKFLLVSIICTSILYYLFSLYCTVRFFGRSTSGGHYTPPVTVLKPLNGLEEGIHENLSSHLKQDYPDYQIIFGVNNEDDPVIPVVERLRREFPNRDIELVVSDRVIGSNLKVSNLDNMYQKAKYEVIIINDSDTRVSTNYLRRIVSELEDPGVGGVTCVYRVESSPGLISALGASFVNNDFVPSALVAHTLGMNFGYGATMAIKRKVLDKIGGFSSLADYIAEDYQMGQRLANEGYELRISDYVVLTSLQRHGFWDQVMHILRWVSTIRTCRPVGYFLRIFTMGMPFTILFLIVSSFSALSVALFLSHWFIRSLTAFIIGRKYLGEKRSLGHYLFLPVLDLIIFVIWCWGLFVQRVIWRGNTFRLQEGGRVTRE